LAALLLAFGGPLRLEAVGAGALAVGAGILTFIQLKHWT
jgi:hypothetical protein